LRSASGPGANLDARGGFSVESSRDRRRVVTAGSLRTIHRLPVEWPPQKFHAGPTPARMPVRPRDHTMQTKLHITGPSLTCRAVFLGLEDPSPHNPRLHAYIGAPSPQCTSRLCTVPNHTRIFHHLPGPGRGQRMLWAPIAPGIDVRDHDRISVRTFDCSTHLSPYHGRW
jgi:hypothetical protein